MDKNKISSGAVSNEGRVSITPLYKSSTVENFWIGTSKDVEKVVGTAAHVQKNDFLATNVLKKLTAKEREYLNGSSASELETVLQTCFDRATERQKAVKASHRMGDRAERRTVQFLDKFHGYAEAYSGVVQVMNAAPGGGYGDAAYGALTLFLSVAVNKVKTEELIDSMMSTLHQQYCRIQMLNDSNVYSTDRMREHTAVVYRLGIEFLYTAVRYYSMSTLRRLCHVVAQPPSMDLTNKISEIQAAIEEMRKEMEVLNGIRLGKMETKLHETAKDVQALRAQADEEQLEQLQRLLAIAKGQLTPRLEAYSDLLGQTFDMRNPAPFDVNEALYNHPSFQAWRKSDDLNLLILRGVTTVPLHTDLSWLSPGAVQLVKDIDEIFESDTTCLLSHFCRATDDWNNRKRRIPAQDILKSLILQVLKGKHSNALFRNDQLFAQTKRDLENVNKMDTERVDKIVDKMFAILQHLLKALKVARFVIVIDRLDEVDEELETVIYSLLDMITNVDLRVKAVITLRTPCSLREGRLKHVLGPRGYKILDFNQDD